MPNNTLSAVANVRTRHEWAEIINADWRKSIESIIQTGRDLAAAKAELAHGEFLAMVETDLPFGAKTAQQLITVATDPKITNTNSSSYLPPSWRVLAPLARLSEHDFDAGVRAGVISKDTSLRAAEAYGATLKKPKGEVWGGERKASTLPSPNEARQIAKATDRLVAASDGKIYSGTTEAEEHDHADRRTRVYTVIDAINAIADCGVAPDAWLASAEDHWLHRLSLAPVEDAITFLTGLRAKMAEGVVDA